MPRVLPRSLASLCLAAPLSALLACGGGEGVVERYDEEVAVAEEIAAERSLSDQLQLDARMLADVLREVDVIEGRMREMNETHLVSENQNVGVYTVEQEADIAAAYSRYLSLRKALFHVAFRHKDYGALPAGAEQDASFLLAYASGLTLYRNAVMFVLLFKDQPNARQKLNEADPVSGVPAGMFDEMYNNITDRENVALVLGGVEEFAERRGRLQGSPLLETAGLEALLERLDQNEAELAEAYRQLSEGKRDVLWTKVKTGVAEPTYRGQTMISTIVGHIRTPLHAPALEPESVRRDLAPLLRPGDVLLTRRDGYLSNTFLPGNWGHAAMYLGSAEDLRALGDEPGLEEALAALDGSDDDGHPYRAIEAIGEGVRMSSLEFALHANMIAVLRPKVPDADKQRAAIRAIQLLGTPYDFAFDLSSQDKIICTELVYRAYAPYLDVAFEDVMGTKTLKPDGLLREVDLAGPEPLVEFIAFGRAADGAFQAEALADLLETISPETASGPVE